MLQNRSKMKECCKEAVLHWQSLANDALIRIRDLEEQLDDKQHLINLLREGNVGDDDYED